MRIAEVGTNNIISKVQRFFQPVKAQRKMRNLIFLLSKAQGNFRNELFDSVEEQRNSGTVFSFQVKAQPNFHNQNFTAQCKYCVFCNFRLKKSE